MATPLESFLAGKSAGLGIQQQQLGLEQARRQAPIQNELAQLQLQGAQRGEQSAQRQEGIGQGGQRLQFINQAAKALLTLPDEKFEQGFLALAPQAQAIGIDPAQFSPDQLTRENLTQLATVTDQFIQNPQQLTALLQNQQANAEALQGAIDPETGKLRPDEQLTVQQRIAARDAGLRGKAPSVTADVVGGRERAKLQAQQELKPELERSIAEAKILGASRGEEIANFPKDLIGLRGKIETADNVIDRVKLALDQIGFFSTGFPGAVLRGLPSSDSNKLRATLDTIQANLGFDRLQEMRDASKTGGALGNVTELELKRLEASMRNLDPNQGDEILAKNLADVLEKYERFRVSQISDVMKRAQRLRVNIEDAGGLPQRAAEIQQSDVVQQFTEGQTATNPQTGQTAVFTGGRWVVQ